MKKKTDPERKGKKLKLKKISLVRLSQVVGGRERTTQSYPTCWPSYDTCAG
jgi:hypothetical protein